MIERNMNMSDCPHKRNHLTRRDFLHGMGIAAAGLIVAGCQPKSTAEPTAQPTVSQPASASPTTAQPTAAQPTAAQATAAGSVEVKATVAIAKADSYEPKLVKQQVQAVLDGIGGIADVLAHGNKVAIKINMTGGVNSTSLPAALEVESYMTHPEVVRALIELLRDAGAKDIYIVEAAYEPASWTKFGFTSMAKEAGATIVDLTNEEPYKDYASTPVAGPGDPFIYEKFTFNHILEEVDAFVSVPKMKCHNVCGVTNSVKNLVGLVPLQFYRLGARDTYRSGFHGNSTEMKHRLPRVVIDLNRARPVNLALTDAIYTAEGGEGPWITGQFKPIKANILLAGKDPVATDAVATACMGFDPQTDYKNEPFVNADNHLNIAASLGMGTNRLAEIKVVGASIDEVKKSFKPSY
jgi:uncharacterized protein (DUF362 family)